MQPQDPGDQPFRHYTPRHRVVAWVSRHLFDHVTYTVRHGLLKDMKRRGGLGWLPEFVAGRSVTREHVFWEHLDLANCVIYDVGAFHGLLTLFFARRGKQVVSYEPNRSNHRRLTENLHINGIRNVTVRQVGAGARAGVATMVTDPLMPGGASVDGAIAEVLRSSNLAVTSEEIRIVALDDDIREASLPAPDFIKIDIEGEELAALQGARNTLLTHRPRLFLEMHGETMNLKRRKVKAIVDFLYEAGYRDIRHVESGAAVTPENSEIAAQGHLYCLYPS